MPSRSGSRPSGRSTPRGARAARRARRASASRTSRRRASPPASTRCSSGGSATTGGARHHALLASDNLRKGAALNAVQIARRSRRATRSPRSCGLGPRAAARAPAGTPLSPARSPWRACPPRPAEARRARAATSSTRPARAHRLEAESFRKSRGNTVLCWWKRSRAARPPGSGRRTPRARPAPRSRASPIAVRKSDCMTQGLCRSTRYAHVTSTASSDGGPAGSSRARGKSGAGPYCIEPSTRPSSSW